MVILRVEAAKSCPWGPALEGDLASPKADVGSPREGRPLPGLLGPADHLVQPHIETRALRLRPRSQRPGSRQTVAKPRPPAARSSYYSSRPLPQPLLRYENAEAFLGLGEDPCSIPRMSVGGEQGEL